MPKTVDEIADAMFTLVKDCAGMKKLKPQDLVKAMRDQFGEEEADKQVCKAAIKKLIDSQRCVYTYFGGSFIEIPHVEGSANQ